MVPNSPVGKGSYIGKNVVLMPCFVNTGSYNDEGTMMFLVEQEVAVRLEKIAISLQEVVLWGARTGTGTSNNN